jgi:hypothetical protein
MKIICLFCHFTLKTGKCHMGGKAKRRAKLSEQTGQAPHVSRYAQKREERGFYEEEPPSTKASSEVDINSVLEAISDPPLMTHAFRGAAKMRQFINKRFDGGALNFSSSSYDCLDIPCLLSASRKNGAWHMTRYAEIQPSQWEIISDDRIKGSIAPSEMRFLLGIWSKAASHYSRPILVPPSVIPRANLVDFRSS